MHISMVLYNNEGTILDIAHGDYKERYVQMFLKSGYVPVSEQAMEQLSDGIEEMIIPEIEEFANHIH